MATLSLKSQDTPQDKSRGRKKQQNQNMAYAYLVPAFTVMAVITFYPLIYQVIVSFTNFETRHLLRGLASPDLQFVGLDNYVKILTGGVPIQNFNFLRVLTYNLWWAITNVIVHVPAGVLIAVLLNVQGLGPKKVQRFGPPSGLQGLASRVGPNS